MEHEMVLPSRGRLTSSYFVLTPENWVDNALPFFDHVVVHPMATPRSAQTRFGQYMMVFEPTGKTLRPIKDQYEYFLYQIDGQVRLTTADRVETLGPESHCFLPAGTEFGLEALEGAPASMLLTKRLYDAVEGIAPPEPIYGTQSGANEDIPSDPDRKELMPTGDPSYDMVMRVLMFQPGASTGMVEIHHQEHGLLMLSGQGIYYLAGDCIEVSAGDYIYMAPYCPQSFWATGDERASYLLYKDVNRDGFF